MPEQQVNQKIVKKAKKQPQSPQQEAIEKTTSYIKDFFYIVGEDGKSEPRFEIDLLCIDCGIVIAVLASACWAASIACARRHNAFVSFLLGLLIPWIYPLVILFAMNIPGKWDVTKKKKEEEKAVMEAAVAEVEENTIKPDENGEIPFEATPAYFNTISRTADGQPAGPWKVTFNGNVITVTKIIEILPEALSVEFHDSKSELKKMRFPYSKIESWEPIKEEQA